MELATCEKTSFVVIGKEGSTKDGQGFIQTLWQEANSSYHEIEAFAKKDEQGCIVGMWGAMSDFSHTFQPWKNFQEGVYLAGVECYDEAEAPQGWTKWIIPGYEYLYAECEHENTFTEVLAYLSEHEIPLVGAVHDFTCPKTQKNYIFFPIRKL